MTDELSDEGEQPANANIAATHSAPSPVKNRRRALRVSLFIVFAIVLALLVGMAGYWWLQVASNYVSTNNAYVDANMANVMSQTSGTIAEVRAEDTQVVMRGDVVVVIDPADARLVLSQAEADYASTVRKVRQYFENNKAAAAQVTLAKAVLNQSEIDLARRRRLEASGSVSEEDLSNAQASYNTALAALGVAQGQYEAQVALTVDSDVDTHPEVLRARTVLDTAQLALDRTIVRAPIDGVVIEKRVALGQRVPVGASMMRLVPLDEVYVNANFKEGQLTRVQLGQTATLTSDLYGKDVVYHGRIVGLSGGTGAAFALIPAQNATGSWIKVVQRLPVRIALDAEELLEHPLRVGLSMRVKIDISE